MADIKKFTGYIAPDGSAHDNLKKATDHTRELKIKAALADFALVTPVTNPGVTEESDFGGTIVILPENLPAFLFAHKADIMAAFTQDVLLRAPRKKSVKVAVAVAVAVVKAAASVKQVKPTAAPIHEGLVDLDE